MDVGEKTSASQESEQGATLLEYSLMAALIAMVAVAAVTFLGQEVSGTFSAAAEGFNTTT